MSAEPRAPVSVIIPARNEERNIGDCIAGVSWAAEIIVLDSGSRDRTREIAAAAGAIVIETEWVGYGRTKNIGLARASQEWILWLDADERVTPELGSEIRTLVGLPGRVPDSYEVARRAYFLGKWIRHCGWYPGYVVRLFRKKAGKFSEREVHEFVEAPPPHGRLRNDLLHYTDETLYHYLRKFNEYTTLAALDGEKGRKRAAVSDLLFRPPFMFLKMYIFRLGFLDGLHGLVLSLLSSAYVFVKYAKIAERRRGIVSGN